MQNLIEKTPRHKKDDEKDGEEKKKRPIIKSATDLQRLKLEKLMKNPDKPIIIPETPREKDYMQTVPSFVRNVMGSSAGAGSGEFHVYRHLRRKEYARQKCIHAKSMREQLDDEYQTKLEKNRLEADAKTAKKRAKRLKKKQRAKKPKTQKNDDSEKQNTTDDDDDEDEDAQSLEKNANEKMTEGADLKAMVVNDDVEICKETAGPQPKEEISISPNKESNQVEATQSCSNADERNRNTLEKDNMKNDKQNEIESKELSKAKENLSYETGNQEAGLEDNTTEDKSSSLEVPDSLKEPTPIQS